MCHLRMHNTTRTPDNENLAIMTINYITKWNVGIDSLKDMATIRPSSNELYEN